MISSFSSVEGIDLKIDYHHYPKGYQQASVIYSHADPNHCLTIEKYAGIHSNEYLECFRVDGQKTGIGTLYKNGERILQCYFECNSIQGWGTIYKNGVPILQALWKDNEVVKFVVLSNTGYCERIDEKREDGSTLYSGNVDLCSYKRNGYGVIYSNNQISIYGKFVNDELIHISKTFSNNIMTEYNEYNSVIYEGEYEDNLQAKFPRTGKGKEFQLRRLLFEGSFVNNQRNGYGTSYHPNGVIAFTGWWKDGRQVEGCSLAEDAISQQVVESKRFVVSSDGSFDCIPMYARLIEEIVVADYSCNAEHFTRFVLVDFPKVTRIQIGSHACSHVVYFAITSLPSIESIVIGKNSFTRCDLETNTPFRNDHEDRILRENRSFFIVNCGHLKRCVFDAGCFSDYLYCTFENLPELEVLLIGEVIETPASISLSQLPSLSYSCCFYYCNQFVLKNFPSLHTIQVGGKSFYKCTSCCLESSQLSFKKSKKNTELIIDLPTLSCVHIDDSAFFGVWKEDRPISDFSILNTPILSNVILGDCAFFNIRKLVIIQPDSSAMTSASCFSIGNKTFYTIQHCTISHGTAGTLIQQLQKRKTYLPITFVSFVC